MYLKQSKISKTYDHLRWVLFKYKWKYANVANLICIIAIMHQSRRANYHQSKSLLLHNKDKFNLPPSNNILTLKNAVTTRAQKQALQK